MAQNGKVFELSYRGVPIPAYVWPCGAVLVSMTRFAELAELPPPEKWSKRKVLKNSYVQRVQNAPAYRLDKKTSGRIMVKMVCLSALKRAAEYYDSQIGLDVFVELTGQVRFMRSHGSLPPYSHKEAKKAEQEASAQSKRQDECYTAGMNACQAAEAAMVANVSKNPGFFGRIRKFLTTPLF